MRFWFQDLRRDDNSFINFRGSINSDKNYKRYLSYQFKTGSSLKFEVIHGGYEEGSETTLIIGVLFFTLYLTFPLPKSWYFTSTHKSYNTGEEYKLIESRVYGFYLYNWALCWNFHSKLNESNSKDPWWMHQYIYIDQLFLGRVELLENKITEIEDIYFMIGNKTFKMDKIEWYRERRFRSYIPLSLYKQEYYYAKMEIKRPPLRAGKGENSWDLDDDGCYGMSMKWEGPKPGWDNREECAKAAIQYYVDSSQKEAKRYGSGSGEYGIRHGLPWTYLGRRAHSDKWFVCSTPEGKDHLSRSIEYLMYDAKELLQDNKTVILESITEEEYKKLENEKDNNK